MLLSHPLLAKKETLTLQKISKQDYRTIDNIPSK